MIRRGDKKHQALNKIKQINSPKGPQFGNYVK